jgi:hypothetical protein
MNEDKHCESCGWMRPRRPTDLKQEAGYDNARHWCDRHSMATLPLALRCGGDEYEAFNQLPRHREVIPQDQLVEGTWYVGRGRNANVALWGRCGKNGKLTFLTIGFTFHNPNVKDEGYYREQRHHGHETKEGQVVRELVSYGCFQPFRPIFEGRTVESLGSEPGWDKHYAKVLEV